MILPRHPVQVITPQYCMIEFHDTPAEKQNDVINDNACGKKQTDKDQDGKRRRECIFSPQTREAALKGESGNARAK